MLAYLGVAVGGAVGALARFGITGIATRRAGAFPSGTGAFPWGTLFVNVSGGFLSGLLVVVMAYHFDAAPWLRSTILIGFLGGYTTLSAVSYDTFRLLHAGQYGTALVNSLGTVVLAVLAVYAGVWAGQMWSG